MQQGSLPNDSYRTELVYKRLRNVIKNKRGNEQKSVVEIEGWEHSNSSYVLIKLRCPSETLYIGHVYRRGYRFKEKKSNERIILDHLRTDAMETTSSR